WPRGRSRWRWARRPAPACWAAPAGRAGPRPPLGPAPGGAGAGGCGTAARRVALGPAEPLGLALVLVGLVLAHEHRALPAGLAFAGAGLAKETYLVFAVAAGVAALT